MAWIIGEFRAIWAGSDRGTPPGSAGKVFSNWLAGQAYRADNIYDRRGQKLYTLTCIFMK
jgi:hypothetical protein